MGWIVSLAGSCVGLFFALIVTGRYLAQKKLPDLLFAVSLYMFSLASILEFSGGAFLWIPWMYKLYYFLVVTLVAVMAAAMLQLEEKPWPGRLFLAYVGLLSLLFLLALIPARVDEDLLFQGGASLGGDAMPAEVRRVSPWLSGAGGLVLLAYSVWAWRKTRGKGSLYLASGILVFGLGGGLARLGYSFLLNGAELLGIVLLFFGYLEVQKQAEGAAGAVKDAAAAFAPSGLAEEPQNPGRPPAPKEPKRGKKAGTKKGNGGEMGKKKKGQ